MAPATGRDVVDPQGGWQKIFALLPPGSELKGVMLPRYDENHQLAGVLKSQVVTLIDATRVAGKDVSFELFNPDKTPRGRIDLATATIYQESELITTRDPVEIKSDRLLATGSGLYYSFGIKNGLARKGFLLGPAITTILPPPVETTMNPTTLPLRATAMLGMSLVSQSLLAVPPTAVTPAEMEAIQADATSRAPAAAAAASAAQNNLKTDLADAAVASKAAATFLVQADLPPVSADATPALAKPLDVKPGPGDTVINCDGGMYFDPDEGVLVYLKNVTVKDPRFDLSGANELKIFFGKKPAKEAKEKSQSAEPDKPKSGFGGDFGANFGDVERIVANGAIVMDQKPAKAGDEPIKASGAVFSYNLKADQIIISGGFPWVLQGDRFLRAKQPNLILRISPNAGSFVTDGQWEMGGKIEQKK